MTKILCVGCSWTYGSRLESNQTYPFFLEQYLNERSHSVSVFNGGLQAADLNLSIMTLFRLEELINPDIVVFQITTADRSLFGLDGFFPFCDKEYEPSSSDIQINDENPSRLFNIDDFNKLRMTPGIAESAIIGANQHTIQDIFEKEIEVNNKTANIKDFVAFCKFWGENISLSRIQNLSFLKDLILLQSYFKNNNKKVLFLFYVFNPFMTELYLYDKLDMKIFLHQPVYDFIRDRFKKKIPDTIFIDDNYHLSKEGNKLIVDEYIGPEVERRFFYD